MTTDLDSTRSAAVDHAYHWQPMTSCPKGSKVQLLTRYGCAISFGRSWSSCTACDRRAGP